MMKLKRKELSIIGVAISCLLLAGCTNQINSNRLDARQTAGTGETAETSETAESLEDQGNELDDYEIDTYSLERQAADD